MVHFDLSSITFKMKTKKKSFFFQNPYALRHVKAFGAICDQDFTIETIKASMDYHCTHSEMINIH